LAAAVAAGRKAEFGAHGWAGDVPDPQDPATFAASKLDWSEPTRPEHAAMLSVYRDLIALRRRNADLSDPRLDLVDVTAGAECLVIRRGSHLVVANLSDRPMSVEVPPIVDSVVYTTGSGIAMRGGAVDLPACSAAVLGP
jgi:maltooligosyltrehalose trehalohydrolase